MSSLLPWLTVFCILCRNPVYVWVISCFQSLHKVFGGKEMIIWSVESLAGTILGFLTSKWLFESLSKSHLGFRSLVFFLSWQSHQVAPFKHCYSLRATFLAVLGASRLRLDMQLMPLDSLLKRWDFTGTITARILQASCLPSFLNRRAVNAVFHLLEQLCFC